jgi:hypothetical protein
LGQGDAWYDLPYPDFTFMYPRRGDKMGTPQWGKTHADVLQKGEQIPFQERIGRAVFSGNCGQTERKHRPRLKKLAEEHPDLMFVSDVNKGDKDRGGAESCLAKYGGDPRGMVKGQCSLSTAELCSFKYLINASPGGTYSGRLKYLFLCGSVVIQVRYDDNNYEFYEKLFTPGKHYYVVDAPEEIPPLIQYLENNQQEAMAVANAGREVIRSLGAEEVYRFMYLFMKEVGLPLAVTTHRNHCLYL